ncbi:MAG: sulfur carrier protein ThiS [Roseburia sp.]|nr:sulfur carrier protein ThiS [Roseburia sp.]
MVQINGENVAADGMTLSDYLAENNYVLAQIAIEYNGVILPKGNCATTILKDKDVVEIVSFVGGGCY